TVAEGAQGPRAYQFVALRVWESRDGLPGRACWLLLRHNLDGTEPKAPKSQSTVSVLDDYIDRRRRPAHPRRATNYHVQRGQQCRKLRVLTASVAASAPVTARAVTRIIRLRPPHALLRWSPPYWRHRCRVAPLRPEQAAGQVIVAAVLCGTRVP